MIFVENKCWCQSFLQIILQRESVGRYERYVAGNLTEMWRALHKPKYKYTSEIQLRDTVDKYTLEIHSRSTVERDVAHKPKYCLRGPRLPQLEVMWSLPYPLPQPIADH